MYILDASSIIHAWDTYPLFHFPPVWDWVEENIRAGEFSISSTALNEVKNSAPDCANWLTERSIFVCELDSNVLESAIRIQTALEIDEFRDYPKGVGENDLYIIATAKKLGFTLVSNESKQPKRPSSLQNYKIPAVCELPSVKVKCISFLDLIIELGARFEH